MPSSNDDDSNSDPRVSRLRSELAELSASASASGSASASAAVAAPRSRRPRSDISWRTLLGGLPATVRRPHSIGQLPAYDDEEDNEFDLFTVAK